MSKDCRNSDTKGSTTFLVVLYFSWMIFSRPHFFTVPIEGEKKPTDTAQLWVGQDGTKTNPERKVSMFFFTVISSTVQAGGPFTAFFRNLLLQRSFLEVHQVGPLQRIHELQFLLFAQHDAGAGLANHLET